MHGFEYLEPVARGPERPPGCNQNAFQSFPGFLLRRRISFEVWGGLAQRLLKGTSGLPVVGFMIHGIWYPFGGRSWNESPLDTKGLLYMVWGAIVVSGLLGI